MRRLAGRHAWAEGVVTLRVAGIWLVFTGVGSLCLRLIDAGFRLPGDLHPFEELAFVWDHVHSGFDFVASLPQLVIALAMGLMDRSVLAAIGSLLGGVLCCVCGCMALSRPGAQWVRRMVRSVEVPSV